MNRIITAFLISVIISKTSQEYRLPLLGMTATEVVGGISGDSEANIRDLFDQAAVRIVGN